MNRPVTAWEIGEELADKPLHPFGSIARRDDALREINRQFSADWQRLLADKAAAEREVERKFWNGEYR